MPKVGQRNKSPALRSAKRITGDSSPLARFLVFACDAKSIAKVCETIGCQVAGLLDALSDEVGSSRSRQEQQQSLSLRKLCGTPTRIVAIHFTPTSVFAVCIARLNHVFYRITTCTQFPVRAKIEFQTICAGIGKVSETSSNRAN